ncbi:hypothetical protein HDU98_011278 [Podochytrium sp. JEL0797]|nr:hypothetical protein HDU98_011278 [Podochytrium sp. JEL0797]
MGLLLLALAAATLATARDMGNDMKGHWHPGFTQSLAACNSTIELTDPKPTCAQVATQVVMPLSAFAKLNPQLDCTKPLPILDQFVCVPDGFNVTETEVTPIHWTNATVPLINGTASASPSASSTANTTTIDPSASTTDAVSSTLPTTTAEVTPPPPAPTTTAAIPDPEPVITQPPPVAAVIAPISSNAMSAQDINDLVAAHNNYRASLGVPPVSWDSTISSQAADWSNYLASNNCMLEHGGTGNYGQNLAMSAGGGFDMQSLFNGWAAEPLDQGFNHATQAAWATSTSIGCATAYGNWAGMTCVVLTCDYYPAGNFGGASWQIGGM